jgi:hypothetical protein
MSTVRSHSGDYADFCCGFDAPQLALEIRRSGTVERIR